VEIGIGIGAVLIRSFEIVNRIEAIRFTIVAIPSLILSGEISINK